MGEQTTRFLAIATEFKQDLEWEYAQTLDKAVRQYTLTNGAPPTSLSALATANGYEWTRTGLNSNDGGVLTNKLVPLVSFRLANNLTDPYWTFSRTLLTTTPPPGLTVDDLLGYNTCGHGDFYTASDWCAIGGLVFKAETRDQAILDQTVARQRMNRTLEKFAAYYNKTGGFPDVASSTTLAAAAGAAVSASSCNGAWNWNGLPLGCDDFYSPWGTLVTYTKVSSSLIVLSVASPLKNASGTALTVAAELGT